MRATRITTLSILNAEVLLLFTLFPLSHLVIILNNHTNYHISSIDHLLQHWKVDIKVWFQ